MRERVIEAQREAVRRLVRLLALDPGAPGVAAHVSGAMWPVVGRTAVPLFAGPEGEAFLNHLQVLLPPNAPFVATSHSAVLAAGAVRPAGREGIAAMLLAMVDRLGVEKD